MPTDNPPAPGATPPAPPAPGAAPATPNGAPPPPAGDPSTAEHIRKLNEENAARRIEAREAKEAAQRAEQRLASLQAAFGAPDAEAAKKQMEQVQARANERFAGALKRAAAVSAAARAGARNPEAVSRLLDLSDVKVDTEKETVDADAIAERVKALRKTDAYLFAEAGAPPAPGAAPPAEPSATPPKPPLAAGGEPIDLWRAMPAGPEKDAFYVKNRDAIVAKLPVSTKGA